MLVRACAENDVREGRGMLVTVAGRDLGIFRIGGVIRAVSNVCAHQHFSVLHRGRIDGNTVTCPMHGWTYDLTTGKSVTGQGSVPCIAVRVSAGDVFVELPEEL
jgi:nitrite reductase/ring-hydroxylating ferredoxin subunit